jgi:glycosyltransferase involved in cell wall biosynthesis
MHVKKYVTVGIPIYRRLSYLPGALRAVEVQDYPSIELIVSENGRNDSSVEDILRQNYHREYIIRRNPETVHISTHYNQLVDSASGDYFVLLCDDDEISPTFVSGLVRRLEDNRDAHVAIGRQEILDESGKVIRHSKGALPDLMDGFEFMRAAWKDYRYKYECFVTTLARTASLRQSGGYPAFHRGTHNDDAALVKLALQGPVAFSNECTFRWRVYPTSHGWSLSIRDLAKDSSEFLAFLRRDPFVREYSRKRLEEWRQVRESVEGMTWNTFRTRWHTMYRERLTLCEWLLAPLWMPWFSKFQKDLVRDALRRILVRNEKAAVKAGNPGGTLSD